MSDTDMRGYWDRKAREDAFYFVDNRLDYGNPDLEQFWAKGEEELDYIFELLGLAIEPADTIVEIGCGVGRLTRVLASRGARVVALDVSERMLDLAREHNPGLANVEWVLGDGLSLAGIEDASADVCISHVVFQHLPDPALTLGYVREIGRVLRTGGWAAIHVSNDPSVHVRRTGFGHRARAVLGRAPRGSHNPAWLGSAVKLSDLRRTAGESGLDVGTVWGEGTQYCQVELRKER